MRLALAFKSNRFPPEGTPLKSNMTVYLRYPNSKLKKSLNQIPKILENENRKSYPEKDRRLRVLLDSGSQKYKIFIDLAVNA